MKKGWLHKVFFAMMLVYSLATVACGAGQDFEDSDEEAIENFGSGNNQNNDDEGVVFFEGGSITTTDGGISASFNDGTGVSFD